MIARRHKDVEDLIFRGFLITKVQLGDVYLVLKSLNPRELDAVRERCPLKTHTTYNEVFEALILAYALYLVAGENVLVGRPVNIPELVTEMRDVPQNLRGELMEEILLLQKAQDVALQRLEAFSYEPASRSMWSSYKGRILNDPMLTGIAGTERLGLNSHQAAWTFLNEEEDKRVEGEMLWGFAKFVASAANPKGVKKVEQRDQARLKRLKDDRERVRLGEEFRGERRIERRTVAELREQLEADVTGKQDLHDRIVAQYETSIRKRRAEREAEQMAKMMEAREQAAAEREALTDEELAQQLSDGGGFVQVYTKEQIAQMRERQGRETLERAQRIRDGRIRRAQEYKQDRQEISRELHKAVEAHQAEVEAQHGPPDRLEIPTGPQGPVGPSRVSTRPARNPRIPGPPVSPPGVAAADSEASSHPRAARPPGPQTGWKTLPDGTRVPVYANTSGRAGGNEGDLQAGGPSRRLTRHTYGPPQQREQGRRVHTKPVSVKKTGTVYTEVPGEDDFFAGSETNFTSKKHRK